MESEEIIIDVKIDTDLATEKLAQTTQELEQLKARQRELTKELREGADATGELGREYADNINDIKELKNQQKALTNIIHMQTSQWQGYGSSLDEQRRKLNDMLHTYDSLDAELRDGSAGKEFLANIQAQHQAVSELEEATGRHQRNVGNYPQIVSNVIPGFDQLNKSLGAIGLSLDKLASGGVQAFRTLGEGAVQFGRTLLTPPIALVVVALSAILAVFNRVSDAIKRNDDASTNLQRAFAQFQPVMTAVNAIFDKMAEYITNAILLFAKMDKAVVSFLTTIGLLPESYQKAADSAEKLVIAQDNLEEKERQYTINSAKRQRDIADLRAKNAQTDKYDAKQREQFLKRAIALEEKDLKDRLGIAKEKARILKEQAKQQRNTSDEMKDKIAQADAEAYKAEEAYSTGVRKLYSQLAGARKEEAKTATASATAKATAMSTSSASATAKAEAEARAKAQEAIRIQRELEDAIAEGIEDATERELAQEAIRSNRRIDELMAKREQWDTESSEYAQINQLIEIEAQRHSEEMNRINGEAMANEMLAQKRRNDEEDRLARERMDREKKKAEDRAKSIRGAVNATIGLLDSFGEKNKAAAIASKTLAVGQIAVDTGKAIAAGIASAQSQPFPLNIAAIATTIATIMSNMATAKNAISSAKFAQGGIVPGASYSGDNVPVWVNSREGIFTIDQQRRLFDIANGKTATDAMDYARLTEALTIAISSLPNPIVDYREFAKFGDRVARLDEIARL